MIETERLVLRQFQESDAEDVFEYLHQPAVHCFYNMKLESLEDAIAEMKKRAENDLYFAIVLKESNKVIGELFSFAEGTDPESEVMDNYSPCWMLNLAYSGKGYAYFNDSYFWVVNRTLGVSDGGDQLRVWSATSTIAWAVGVVEVLILSIFMH